MREIKFRAWDTCEKQFIHDTGVPHTGFRGNEYLIYQQFTGLKDKNGKEIYEGDILQISPRRAGKVVYVDDLASFDLVHTGEVMHLDSEWIEEEGYQVIGNIYENPEPISYSA